jgi:hypothetical protein
MATQASLSMTQGTTVYSTAVQSRINQSATEASNHRTIRAAGVYSKMWLRVLSNGVSAGTTVTFRVSGVDSSITFTVGAGSSGEFSDLSNTATVAATDEVSVKFAVGAGGTTFNPSVLTLVFTPDDAGTTYCPGGPGTLNISGGSDSTTYYFNIASGFNSLNTTEANVQTKMRAGGTLKNFFMSVATNGRTTETTYRSRKNGGNGNLVIPVGVFEDTSNTDTFAVDDLFALSGTTSTGGGNIIAQGGVSLESTDRTMHVIGGALTSVVVSAGQTNYLSPGGQWAASATETGTQSQFNLATTASKLQVYVSANTVTANSTLKTRINGANGGQTATITDSTSGWFEDASGTDSIADGDEVNFVITTGGTGTSLTLQTTVMLLTMPAPAGRVTRNTRAFPLGMEIGMNWLGNV